MKLSMVKSTVNTKILKFVHGVLMLHDNQPSVIYSIKLGKAIYTVAKCIANLICWSCGCLQSAVYFSRQDAAYPNVCASEWLHQKQHGSQTFSWNTCSSKFVHTASYHVMVKSVFWCCVCASWSWLYQIYIVTYSYI